MTDTTTDIAQSSGTRNPLVDKAVRLFTFLSRAQLLKERAVRDVDQYKRSGGSVLWFMDFPDHPAVRWSADAEDADAAVLSVERLDRQDPPDVPADIREWVIGDINRATQPPLLRPSLVRGRRWDDELEEHVDDLELIDDRSDVRQSFEQWMARWRPWAEEETRSIPVRDLYTSLFSAHVESTQKAEELELVLGVGLLAWHPEQHQSVRRHAFTVPVEITIEERTGALDIHADASIIGLRAELDMLDPEVLPTREIPSQTETRASSFSAHPLDREASKALGSPLVHALDGQGKYVDETDLPSPTDRPTLSWSPAIVLRPRPKGGLAQAFAEIAQQIDEAGEVPSGLLPLLDPDKPPAAQPDPSPGAMLAVDGEIFSPLPLNEVQRRIIERVDRTAQTLVQGPPGTGKTHTAAALLSHLLAQGKRVLVTAHTERALYEVRGKLPDQIRNLAVSVIGAGRQDMAELRVAVDTISRNATEHDVAATETEIATMLDEVERLRRERQMLNEQLLDAREKDVRVHRHGSYEGTLASMAQQYYLTRDDHGWVLPHLDVSVDISSPLQDAEASEWLALLRDEQVVEEEPALARRAPELSALPSPEDFASHVSRGQQSREAAGAYSRLDEHPARQAVAALPTETRLELQRRLEGVVELARSTSQLRAPWVAEAITDVRQGLPEVWRGRAQHVESQLDYVRARTSFLGPNTRVDIGGDPAQLMPLAQALRTHVHASGELKTNVDGSVKTGMFTPSVVKQCRALLDQVRVDGRAPATTELIDKFTAHVETAWALDGLDRAWPAGTQVPSEDTFVERTAWHAGQLSTLHRVLSLQGELASVSSFMAGHGLPPVDWADTDAVVAYGDLVDAVAAHELQTDAHRPLDDLKTVLAEHTRWGDSAADWVVPMDRAVTSGDHKAYAEAHERATVLADVARRRARRDELTSRVREAQPRLADAVTSSAHDDSWDTAFARLEGAFGWASLGAWIRAHDSLDANQVQDQIDVVEQRLREVAETIAAKRAWNHAVGPDRLSLGSRADLTQYSQLVRKLGKGTGKYAQQQRAEAREALDRCRPSVPVWIMPIYRVVDQLRISEDMFDVVLIDEASQAGLEAAFLQYLAPKIVVIGDDKQVSPSAVGVDQQQLRDLADQYLHDDRYKASWQDPQRSLFDEALMRYGGTITLVEHRRCVPEIIGFSNRIAYEPDGIRLVPVRQFGANRLEPIKITRTPDGFEEGSSGSKINRVEATALVSQLVSCLDDPAYDGRTFGVITLLGTAQGKLIEQLLLEQVPAETWSERELQVGAPPDFQGSERDVIFLSMVSSAVPGQRLAALTREMYVQRYNVAVSRAKDQVWLFHTITTNDLTNEQDMRFQLLDYAYGVARRGRDLAPGESAAVPDDQRVEGFDSLFEQRVYNKVVDRGFTVIPQYEAQGYRIDLVVVGAKGMLAIECDGDEWHGPDRYAADLARQRDLERCGWTFFRVRESMYYVDQAAALSGLWQVLDDLEIRPSDWLEVEDADDLEVIESAVDSGAALEATASDDPAERPGDSAAVGLTETGVGVEDDDQENLPVVGVGAVPPPPPPAPAAETRRSMTDGMPGWLSRIPESAGEEPADTYVSRHANVSEQPLTTEAFASDVSEVPAVDEAGSSALGTAAQDPSDGLLLPYAEYSGRTVPVADGVVDELVEGLVAVVGAEGPVRGERLLRAYVQASGGRRVGKAIAKQLNHAVSIAERDGRLVMDNPLHQAGIKPRTYRLAHQPVVAPRLLGPRALDEVPPAELETVMRLARSRFGAVTDEEVMRYTLHLYGKKSLTQAVRTLLEPIIGMLHAHDDQQSAEAGGSDPEAPTDPHEDDSTETSWETR